MEVTWTQANKNENRKRKQLAFNKNKNKTNNNRIDDVVGRSAGIDSNNNYLIVLVQAIVVLVLAVLKGGLMMASHYYGDNFIFEIRSHGRIKIHKMIFCDRAITTETYLCVQQHLLHLKICLKLILVWEFKTSSCDFSLLLFWVFAIVYFSWMFYSWISLLLAVCLANVGCSHLLAAPNNTFFPNNKKEIFGRFLTIQYARFLN